MKFLWPASVMVMAVATSIMAAVSCGQAAPSSKQEPAAPSSKQEPAALTKVTVGIPIPRFDPHNAFLTVPLYTGWFKDEGLDVSFFAVAGGGGDATQLVLAGSAEFSVPFLDPLAEILARGTNPGAKFFYNIDRESLTRYAAVPLDSPIRDYKDLKGKKIGVQTQAASSLAIPKAALKYYGLDPETDVEWLPVGVGGQLIAAVNSGQVDAIFHTATVTGAAELSGLKVRHLDTVPIVQNLQGAGILAKTDYLKANRKVAVGLGRAIAKGTLFTLTNPTAAVKIHFKMVPEVKPQGASDEEAVRQGVHLLEARLPLLKVEGRKIPKWGAYEKEQTEYYTRFIGRADKIPDVTVLYTDEFIDDFNAFDPEPVKKAALEFKDPR